MILNALNRTLDRARSAFSNAFREFRFKDFLPKLFARIRQIHGITAEEYASAFETTCRERFSEGRSGAFLFFSKDQRYIVKTMSQSESLTLRQVLQKYLQHLEMNPSSLIVRFLGAHSLTMYGVEIFFVVMLNVFPTAPLSERYDLKGSWVNRYGKRSHKRTRKQSRKPTIGNRSKSNITNSLNNNNNNNNGRMLSADTASSESNEISSVNNGNTVKATEDGETPLYQDNDMQHTICLDPDTTRIIAEVIRKDVQFLKSKSIVKLY
jgi:hypothetical protein